MKTVILAAGRSRRAYPLRDKVLLPFVGRSLLRHKLEQVAAAGLKDVVIVANAENLEALQREAEGSAGRVDFCVQDNLELGMAGAILAAEERIGGEDFLVINVNDCFEDQALTDLLEAREAQERDSFLLAQRVRTYFPGGYLRVEDDNRIVDLVEKPGPGREPSDLVTLVLHYHRDGAAFCQALRRVSSSRDDLYECALVDLIQRGHVYRAVPYEGAWQALKYAWQVLDVMDFFLRQIQEPQIAEDVVLGRGACLEGPVIAESGVRLYENALVKGPAYLGPGCIVANGGLVRSSMLGPGCVVGFATEIARSYLEGHVWTHSNYIGDSVVSTNVSFGAGAVTANLRLDEGEISVTAEGEKRPTGRTKLGAIIGRNGRVGVNVSLLPGTVIGENTAIGPGLVVGGEIPPHRFVKGKTELAIVPNRLDIATLDREAQHARLSRGG